MSNNQDPMLDMYIFENEQLMEQLEEVLISEEKSEQLSDEAINTIFRILHTIKGSSAMMEFTSISTYAHSIEDMFFYIRENTVTNLDWSYVVDLVLQFSDFTKYEVSRIVAGETADTDVTDAIVKVSECLEKIKAGEPPSQPTPPPAPVTKTVEQESVKQSVSPSVPDTTPTKKSEQDDNLIPKTTNDIGSSKRWYHARIIFEDDCKMEHIRAFGIVNELMNYSDDVVCEPSNLSDESACDDIIANGFSVEFETDIPEKQIRSIFSETMFIKSYTLSEVEVLSQVREDELDDISEIIPELQEEDIPEVIKEQQLEPIAEKKTVQHQKQTAATEKPRHNDTAAIKQSFISVNVDKLDKLMDLVAELVITESMVIRNPDLAGLNLENFEKSARSLRKLTDELQDVVMSVRMIPISSTFNKMLRIVRDMSRKINKDVDVTLVGEETEVDKNILENLSDPLMHIIRNSIDHGLEDTPEEREAKGKRPVGRVILEAKNSGGDIIISVSDDGKGLNRDKILAKAQANGLLTKDPSELTEKEIFGFILLPGFSTNEIVTEFSGRGVGLDVVAKNVQSIGGSIMLDSKPDVGTTTTIKIPLTLAIVDGMEILVGDAVYILPTLTIRESFKAKNGNIILDPSGNEMIMIRGECFPIVRLHEKFGVDTSVTDLEEGIMILVEGNSRSVCLFADKLIGEQQVVVKPIPAYITKQIGEIKGIGGCAVLGDGSICLILEVNGFC